MQDVLPVLAGSGQLDLRERARGSEGLRHAAIRRCRQDVWSRSSISPAGPTLPSACSSSPRKSKAPNPPFASIVGHCSASVGQTGRFIVIVGMMDKMHAGQEVDVFGFVWKPESSVCSSSRRTCVICSSTRRQNA
ncbi:receptor-type tyrosine-protein phosphatase alpha-like [Hippocampus comes]|uniref:receptor-type tyrosine-protein phosphatase alpha-like n=1 Tax=Hippocampus comes TaxID=109280 RepID=UPI00094F03A0|nr:PREDICTED: receptor-type tyrosine-protein phosphatase alpha-like [Hippocampus comes]